MSSPICNANNTTTNNNTTTTKMEVGTGWRVKLYRLNVDGSWDDCGTGRICCQYSSKSTTTKEDDDSNKLHSTVIKEQELSSTEWIYQKLKNPVLYMHAEGGEDLLLLQTRILLQDTYQRQGDNIITWSQPVTPKQPQQQHGYSFLSTATTDATSRVDLALSFQDNAGCLDIWNHISIVQQKAMDYIQQMTTNHDTKSLVYSTKEPSLNHLKSSISTTTTTTSQQEQNLIPNDPTIEMSLSHPSSTMLTSSTSRTPTSTTTTTTNNGTPSSACSFCGLPNPPLPHNLEDIAEILHASMNPHHHYSTTSSFFSSPFLFLHQSQPTTTTTMEQQPPPQTPTREDVSKAILEHDFNFFRNLLQLYPILMTSTTTSDTTTTTTTTNNKLSDLCTLASIVKLILLFNLEPLLELLISDTTIFCETLQILEYDPELRIIPAQHIHHVSKDKKFKTVVWIDNTALEEAIHKCWRITYFKDFVLRPTMVEDGTIATLTHLLQRTHLDIVRFVGATTTTTTNNNSTTDTMGETSTTTNRYEDCYLAKIMRMLGTELYSTLELQPYPFQKDTTVTEPMQIQQEQQQQQEQQTALFSSSSSTTNSTNNDEHANKTDNCDSTRFSQFWKQHLLPQDSSLSSRILRRQGCLQFLRELFSMVRSSLQHNAKYDFYVGICLMDVSILQENKSTKVVNLLQLLGLILSHVYGTSLEEKSAALEVIFAIACFDSSLIRRHVMDETCQRPKRPSASTISTNNSNIINQDEGRAVVLPFSENDLLLSLCSIMATETDAGLLLQTLELLRVLLDTDMHHQQALSQQHDGNNDNTVDSSYHHLEQQHDGAAGLLYEEIHDDVDDEIVANAMGTTTSAASKQHVHKLATHPVSSNNNNNETTDGSNTDHANNNNTNILSQDKFSSSLLTANNPFLGIFYEYYMHWLVAPFQCNIVVSPSYKVDDDRIANESTATSDGRKQQPSDMQSNFFRSVPKCAVRANFALEILCFCVRAHGYRMKNFVLRGRVLSFVLKLLTSSYGQSGDECLKLAALRFLRTVISMKDEFYLRHIVQHDLFAPVFDLLLSRHPVGDNLVSSSIIEMCEFIKAENMKTLLEYIVTRFIYTTRRKSEDVSSSSQQPETLHLPMGSSAANTQLSDSKVRSRVSLEDLSDQHVHTFKLMRQKHEENLTHSSVATSGVSGKILRLSDRDSQSSCSDDNDDAGIVSGGGKQAFLNGTARSISSSHQLNHQDGGEGTGMEHSDNCFSTGLSSRGILSNQKALEDQRKFREIDDEESYFNGDDDDEEEIEQDRSSSSSDLAEGSMLGQGHVQNFSTTTNRVSDQQSAAVANSWMPIQYGDSSDEDDDFESSNSSADDTDSSTSSIITNVSSTSDAGKEDFEDWRATKRARILYGTAGGGDESERDPSTSVCNEAAGLKTSSRTYHGIPTSDDTPGQPKLHRKGGI